MPHRAVVQESRINTKARIVFDASAHESSLINVLYSGACMLPLLFDILARFKFGKTGVVSDITQVFLQIKINEQHCNFFELFGETIFQKRVLLVSSYILREMCLI